MRFFYTKDGKKHKSFLSALDSLSNPEPHRKQVLNFISFGANYFDQTPVCDITKDFTHQNFIISSKNGFIEEKHNHHLQREAVPEPYDSFLKFFQNRREVLEEKKISVDLTGGIDSRLVACMLKHAGISFDATYSLGSGNQEEALIVKQVATCLGCKLDIISPKEINSDDHLNELFSISDGCLDLIGLNSLYQLQKWRQEKGYDLVITGVGGELYKDFWWLQDFPIYNSKKPDLNRLLDYRMYPNPIPDSWIDPVSSWSYENAKQSMIKKLESYILPTNTETYDNIYHQVRIREQVSALTCASNNFINVYSPLLEKELLQTGFNLPRRKRFFNRFHRDIITRVNPELAKIPTTEGNMSVSNNYYHLCTDALRYISDKTGKSVNKLRRKYKHHSLAEKKPLKKNTYLTNKIEEAICVLKQNKIFSENAPHCITEVSENVHGRLLTIAMILRNINK